MTSVEFRFVRQKPYENCAITYELRSNVVSSFLGILVNGYQPIATGIRPCMGLKSIVRFFLGIDLSVLEVS